MEITEVSGELFLNAWIRLFINYLDKFTEEKEDLEVLEELEVAAEPVIIFIFSFLIFLIFLLFFFILQNSYLHIKKSSGPNG